MYSERINRRATFIIKHALLNSKDAPKMIRGSNVAKSVAHEYNISAQLTVCQFFFQQELY